MSSVPRIAHLVSHPIQYSVPLYRELAKRGNVDLSVFFRSTMGLEERFDLGFGTAVAWDTPLLGGYHSTFLSGATRTKGRGVFNPVGLDIAAHILTGNYDILWVHGYNFLVNQMAIMAAHTRGTSVLLRDTANLLNHRHPLKLLLKTCMLRTMMKLVTGGLYIGDHNYAWYQHYGLPADRLFYTPYAVDNAYFQAEARRLSSQRAELRRQLGFADHQTVFLFSGKLIDKKAPLDLVKAFSRLDVPCGLLFAGDGPLHHRIEQEARRLGINGVTITGFLNQSEISRAYAAADVLVLPSVFGETWGLAVNEGLNFGLPVIASDKVGCAINIVEEGHNGHVFPAGDVDRLASLMSILAKDTGLRRRYGAHSLDIISRYSITATAVAIEQACYAVTGKATAVEVGLCKIDN